MTESKNNLDLIFDKIFSKSVLNNEVLTSFFIEFTAYFQDDTIQKYCDDNCVNYFWQDDSPYIIEEVKSSLYQKEENIYAYSIH